MSNSELTFAQRLDELIAASVAEERLDETDDEIAISMLEFVFKYERLRRQVNEGTDEAAAVDGQTISKLRSWDSNDPAMSTVEKVLRRLAEGRGSEGIKLLKAAIESKAKEFSKKQTEIAKKPRTSRRQPITDLIEQIVFRDPRISQHELLKALKRKLATMDDPPYSHSGQSFKSRDKKFPDIKDDALRKFLHRAKKKLSP